MSISNVDVERIEREAKAFREEYHKLRNEIQKVIVGQGPIIDGVLATAFVGGHVLLEGVPGLGKTLLIRTVAQCLDLEFSRVQFTPDLMPADILGTTVATESDSGERVFRFRKGPIFAQIVLADEVNRATPKTQSAMLEAMQESSVTISGETHMLDQPFMVLATQNPLEMEGTYPLPEAQLDRFLLKLSVPYVSRSELQTILDRTTEGNQPVPQKVMDGSRMLHWRSLIREIVVAPHVKDYAIRLVLATHPGGEYAAAIANQFLRWGASPRAAQAITLVAKFHALLDGRWNVSYDDIREAAMPALRHRVIRNFDAEAESVDNDQIISTIVEELPRVVEEEPAPA